MKVESFFFVGSVSISFRLSIALSALEVVVSCRIFFIFVGFVGICFFWRENDFYVDVFILEFRVFFGREINFLIFLGVIWNFLKIFFIYLSLGYLCNLLYLFVCIYGFINFKFILSFVELFGLVFFF